MSKVTAADKLIARGFDYSIDGNNGIFDPYYDDADVLKQLEINPALKAVELSKLTKLPSHRVIAAMMRLKADGKLPVNPPAGIVVDFPTETCSKGNIETVEPVATEEPLTVITLWQPWATFIAKGIKLFETRGWIPDHSGRILIHASASHKLNWSELDIESLEEIYPDVKNWDYPLGAIVAEAELINCHRVEAVRDKLGEAERLCGNYSNGRYAWELTNVKPIFIPNVKGKQKLWKYDGNIEPLTISDDVVLGETVQSDEPIKPDIPHWITGRNAAEAKALIDLGFWCVGSVDNWGEPEAKEIIETSGDWSFNYDQIGLFIEARCGGAVFNINVEDEQTPEQDRELVGKAIATIKKASEQWGLQFGEQLELKLDCEQSQNILLTDPPRLIEPDGQLSIFFDSSEEPPDPDDYETGDEYEEAYDKWAALYPEIERAINQAKVREFENTHWSTGDYVQLISDRRRIGQLIGIKNNGLYEIKFADGFKTELKAHEFLEQPFCKEKSEVVLGESFFKVGEFVVTSAPGFEDKIFKVEKIYHTGMIGVVDKSNQSFSFPANWLNHYVEKVGKSNKGKILENSERKRPAKGCGTGYLTIRKANIKRNAAKGRDPDIYYVYCYDYTDNYGKKIKSSISVPREKINHVKGMIEKKEHYVKIAKFLGKSLPCYY